MTHCQLRAICAALGIVGALSLGCSAEIGLMRWSVALPGVVICAALIAVGTQKERA